MKNLTANEINVAVGGNINLCAFREKESDIVYRIELKFFDGDCEKFCKENGYIIYV